MKFLMFLPFVLMLFSCNTKADQPLFRIVEKGKYGFIDSLGNKVIDPKYDYASRFNDELTLVINDSVYGYINKRGKEVIPLTNSVFNFASALYFADKYRSHLRNTPDTIFNFEEFDTINYSEGLVAFVDSNKLFGYRDRSFREVIECKFTSIKPFSEGLAVASVSSVENNGEINMEKFNKETGIIDKQGNFIVPPQYYLCFPFKNGYATAIIRDSGMDGDGMYLYNLRALLIDNKGNIATSFDSEVNMAGNVVGQYVRGVNVFMNRQKYIDISGRLNYDIQNYIFIDAKDPIKVSTADNAYIFPVKLDTNNKWGLMPHDTKFYREDWVETYFAYDDMKHDSEGLIAVKKDNLWGFIDYENNIQVPFKYTNVQPFQNGLAYVETKQIGAIIKSYINKQGKVIYSFLEYSN